MNKKPLGQKCYGSIPHLPNSRLGSSDSCVDSGQAKICTVSVRDKHDVIIVQEKLDGSNVGVALLNGTLIPLTRSGYHASTSRYQQHHWFADWVEKHEARFRHVLREGERICGEWLAQAHGTLYTINELYEPFIPFDIINGARRMSFVDFIERLDGNFRTPTLLHAGNSSISVEKAMGIHEQYHFPCDQIEGVVYRVERRGEVDFLAKYVRQDKVDGKYLPEVSGKEAVWNWRPDNEPS